MRFVEAVGLAQLAVYACESRLYRHRPSILTRPRATVFSGLRIYALWGRNFLLFAIVLLLGLVPVGTNLVRLETTR